MIDSGRARSLAGTFAQQRILVLGDLMLDRYVYGDVNRISPEAPVPVVHVRREERQVGGAANVALNVMRLGGGASMLGAIGSDAEGDELLALLRDSGCCVDGVVCVDDLQTTVKTRVLAERQQVVRVDREDPVEAVLPAIPAMKERLAPLLADATALIIEDYGKGVIAQEMVDAAVSAATAAGVPIGLDPKDNHHLAFSGLALATPNYREACDAAGMPPRDIAEDLAAGGRLPQIAAALQERWDVELLLITLGPGGMYIAPRGQDAVLAPTQAREVFDVSGAGDTVIAVATMALAAGASHIEAAALANHAAGVVVGKLGTATCTADELCEALL
jgi:D-beta-D-heptose 7-phosphate kinase/D-beta-D-heptose 1-phosphate adenosyltransferase